MLTNKERRIERRFEETLAFHCAPAMAGIKAADLISWPGTAADTEGLLTRCAAGLAAAGISFRLLRFRRDRSLILVYRRERLAAQLAREEVNTLLARDGYPAGGQVEAMLDHLSLRMAQLGDFPHEVGLFLGYPVEDVEGFRKHNGQDYKYSGLWKVYSDVAQAQACFHRYHCCRKALSRRVQSGCPLAQVFRAA